MQRRRYRFHPFLHAGHLIEERLRLRLKPLNVQPRQARILDALARLKGASQVVLAREFNLTPASMSTMTTRLIKAGLVTREPGRPSTRSSRLTLTDHGRALLTAIRKVWQDVDRDIEDILGQGDADDLERLALLLRNGLGGRTPGGDV